MSESASDLLDSLFDLNPFGDSLEDDADLNVPFPRKPATKKDIEKLLKFIGGFEYWSVLNEDCRMEVVKYLDYKERFKLGICSKSDYATVEKVPIYVYSVEIVDNERNHYSFSNEEFDNVLVKIQLHPDFNSGKRFELIFNPIGEDTQIQWLHFAPRKRPEKQQVILNSCNYYEEAVKFAEKWMKKCNYELKSIKVEMSKYPFETSQIKKLPDCKDVRIGADDVESFNWWFERVPEQLNYIELLPNEENRDTFTLPTEFLNAPQITQSSNFYFYCRAAFTDDQFLNLKAKKMSFDCVDVTDDAINQFIKKWVNGKGIPDFKSVLFWANKNRSNEKLIKGLEVQQWNEEFEREAGGFCGDFARVCGRGTTYQINNKNDSYESLTLDIQDDRTSIYATGKRIEWNGQTYKDYSIPM